MRTVLLVVAGIALAQEPATLSFRHLYTFGSKLGIHPARILNRKPLTAALGKGEHPYGLGYPSAVVTDLRHRVWIADSGTASIHVFDPATGAYREFRRCGDVTLQVPWGLAADRAGRIYLTDSGTGGILVFNAAGEFDHPLFQPGEHPLEHPGAIALSESGSTIYVADPPRNVVVELNREGEVTGTIPLPEELSDPSAISVVDNQIHVMGSRQHRVASFAPSGVARGELQWDGIRMPSAFAYDSVHQRFLVANPRWMVVQIFDRQGTNLGSFGQMGEGVDQVQRISGIFVDPQGRAYVVDSSSGKVLVFGATEER